MMMIVNMMMIVPINFYQDGEHEDENAGLGSWMNARCYGIRTPSNADSRFSITLTHQQSVCWLTSDDCDDDYYYYYYYFHDRLCRNAEDNRYFVQNLSSSEPTTSNACKEYLGPLNCEVTLQCNELRLETFNWGVAVQMMWHVYQYTNTNVCVGGCYI